MPCSIGGAQDAWRWMVQGSPVMDLLLGSWCGESKSDLRPFSVALCTATFNRLWQLKRALPLTLMHCYPFREKRPGWKMLRASALNILEYH